MTANIDTMFYIGDTPWHGLGCDLTDNPPRSSEEIIHAAQLEWTVKHIPMFTELHKSVKNYHAIYREDTNNILGVVNRENIQPIQNTDMFNTFNDLIGNEIEVETAASLGIGEKVFGCFKVNKSYNVVDDKVDHYFVILNDHSRSDGKVTVLNTPIRVVCQNTLTAALGTALQKVKVPIYVDPHMASTFGKNVFYQVAECESRLNKQAESMLKEKVSKDYVDTVMDNLFPFDVIDGDIDFSSKKNENVMLTRDTFRECLEVDNLANYRHTKYAIYNALADFTQHYYKNIDKAYDLNYRMKRLPGIFDGVDKDLATKYLKIADKIAA